MYSTPVPGRSAGHVAIVHGDRGRAEQLSRLLHAAGHRVSVCPPGPDLAQGVVRHAPDVLLVSHSIGDVAAFVRAVRRALADDVRILLLHCAREPESAPPETDDVLCDAPLQPGELQIRVGHLMHELSVQRSLQKKISELLGLYKMSWAFSLAGGADGLFGQMSHHTADMLRAERALLLLYDRAKRELVAQAPGYGVTPKQLQLVRYSVDGEARSRWDFRINGALLSNEAQSDPRLPQLVKDLGPRSLMVAPIIRGHAILGLLAVADRVGNSPFTDDDLELLRALAGQATIAVENLRLNEELRRANEQLQEFDRLKNQFVGIVAHDFRKPLMAIRGFAELVLEDPDLSADARREFMRTVISESEQLAALANDTLLITQIETGQFRYDFREIDLGPFLLDAVPLGLADHSILVNVPAGFPQIYADPDRLRQVITNLVSNAVKYSPAGSSISVRARPYDEQHVALEVEDNGIGIPLEQTGKLFQKFARIRTEAHMKVSGTGLGLYICRLIVEGHGGHIWVQTEPRGGATTFGFTLPLDARKARPAEEAAAPSAS